MKTDAQRAYIRGFIEGKKAFNPRIFISGMILGITIGYMIIHYLSIIKQLF